MKKKETLCLQGSFLIQQMSKVQSAQLSKSQCFQIFTSYINIDTICIYCGAVKWQLGFPRCDSPYQLSICYLVHYLVPPLSQLFNLLDPHQTLVIQEAPWIDNSTLLVAGPFIFRNISYIFIISYLVASGHPSKLLASFQSFEGMKMLEYGYGNLITQMLEYVYENVVSSFNCTKILMNKKQIQLLVIGLVQQINRF